MSLRNIITGLITVAVGVCMIVTLGAWCPQWEMSWLVYLSERDYRKYQETIKTESEND